MQFGSSSSAVFFKMRVQGVLHIFQFETKPGQGEEICLALTTHINDVMHRRYTKRAMGAPGIQQGQGDGGEQHNSRPANAAVEEVQPPPVLPEVKSPGVFAATYERTVQDLSDRLEKANAQIDLVRPFPFLALTDGHINLTSC